MPTSHFGTALYGPQRGIADDFAGVEAPKLKFNFTMSLNINLDVFNPEIDSWGNDDRKEIKFGIKQISRPNPTINYEDVNYYNYMTKVATKMDFGSINIILYDDRMNRAHKIFKEYLRAVSPITNLNREQSKNLINLGMSTSSGIGKLPDTGKNGPINSIRVTHFITMNDTVIYDYLNPKIQNVVLDELDMSTSDVNTINFTFIYDSFNITYQ